MNPQLIDDVRAILVDFLGRTGISLIKGSFDENFATYCCEIAVKDGFDIDFIHSVAFQRFLQLGARMASTGFGMQYFILLLDVDLKRSDAMGNFLSTPQ